MRRQSSRDRGRSGPKKQAYKRTLTEGRKSKREEAGAREDEKRRLKEEAEERSRSEATRLAFSVGVMRRMTPSASGKAKEVEGEEDMVTTGGPSPRVYRKMRWKSRYDRGGYPQGQQVRRWEIATRSQATPSSYVRAARTPVIGPASLLRRDAGLLRRNAGLVTGGYGLVARADEKGVAR